MRFGGLLGQYINSKYASKRAFARAAEPERNEAGTASYISKVIRGLEPPPMARVYLWASALSLTNDEMNSFISAALRSRRSHKFVKLLKKLQQAQQVHFTQPMVRIEEPSPAYAPDTFGTFPPPSSVPSPLAMAGLRSITRTPLCGCALN